MLSNDLNIPPSKTVEFSLPTTYSEGTFIWQYRNSENLKSYLDSFLLEVNELTKAAEDTINYRYLADAYGYQLDVIGEILGQGRVFFGANPLGYFGFYDDPQSKVPSIGDKFDITKGGIYKGLGDRNAGDLVLGDEAYRRALYAKVIQNGSNCRIDHMLKFIDLITGLECNTEITESGKCSFHIFIHEDLTQTQRVNVSLLTPQLRPAGVSMSVKDNYGIIDLGYSTKNASITEFRRRHGF